MTRSKLLIGLGVFWAFMGVYYFFNPSREALAEHGYADPYTAVVSAWMVASGIGLILHRRWAFWLMAAGTVAALLILLFALVTGRIPLLASLLPLVAIAVFPGLTTLAAWNHLLRTDDQSKEAAE